MKTIELCDCGQPLHYSRARTQAHVEFLVALYGPTAVVETPSGTWRVPRHYIALHGIPEAELPFLARRYKWEKVTDV